MALAKFTGVILIVLFISSVNFINARNVTSIKTLVTFESGTKLMESSNNDGHFEVSGRANSSEYATNTNLIAKRKLAELNGHILHANDTNIYAKSKHNNKRKNNVYNTRHHTDSYGVKVVRKRETNATGANVTSHYDDELLLDDVTGLNNTNCSNDYCISDEDYLSMIDDYMFPTSYEWLLIVLHSMVFLIGLVGNALVCVAVYRNHSMRTVTNYFIVNLAVADFMVILFCLPPTVLWDVTETWFMGDALCKVVLYIQTVSVTVSVLTLTFISIDRWYAICFPLKFKSTTGRAKTAILVIWLLALAFDIPELVVLRTFKRLERVDTHYFIQCEASWSKDSDTTWSVVKMILLYAFPLGFMSIAYLQIVRVLWQSDNIPRHMAARPGAVGVSGSHRQNTFTMNSNASMEGQLRSRRKAAKMLVAVVVMFAVCYFPVHLFSVLRLLIQLPQNDTNTTLALLSHWMCYANSAVNPVIYNFMSGKFRKEFRSTFGCNCCYKKTSQAQRQRNMTRSSTYVYRFTHGGSTIARTEVLPLSQLQQNHQASTKNNHGYALHDTDHYMHTVC